jgi:recombination associated protein RdgC
VIEHLCHCLGDFLPQPLHTQRSPQAAMADWLAAGEGPTAFCIDRDCELKGCGAEKAAVRYVNQPLTDAGIAAEIKAHLAAGQLPTRLALTFDDRLSFVLTERLEIKRLAFLDVIQQETVAENADEQFDADFALMTGEFVRFLPALVEALGGEEAA